MYYKPKTRHAFRKKEPKNEYNPSERVCIEAGINPADLQYTEYTLPFNEENFDNLYSQRPAKESSSVSLVIWAEGASDKPRQVVNPEQFEGEFDPLWEESSN